MTEADTTQTAPDKLDALPQELLERLDALSQKVGVGIEHMWEVLVRQAYVDAVTSSLLFLGCLLLWGAVYAKRAAIDKWVQDGAIEYKHISNSYPRLFPVGIALAALGVATLLLFIWAANAVPVALLNPEYHALEKIMDMVK